MDFLITFLEGIVTFISPCILPMLPIYSNIYFDFYTANLHDYPVAEKSTWSQAIVEAALYIAPPEEEAAEETEEEDTLF